ncbi:MAG: site-2 protease family protein [Erysipelotrichales bacterium]|nr:site-2 protease family protein [Erysipelotrichales bacterium]
MILASSISIWSVLLFILSLGLLITIHELGHFSMAKLFNVYVNEFAIGFGPRLLKFKKGETTYALRAIPLGGFVSMYGEGVEITDGSVPPERSLLGIKKWKRAIIMVAGITLNFILGFTLFFVNNAFFPQANYTNQVTIIEGEKITSEEYKSFDIETGDYIIRIDKKCTINGDSNACSSKSGDIKDFNDLWYSEYGFSYTEDILPVTEDDKMEVTIHYVKENTTTDESKQITLTLSPAMKDGKFVLESGRKTWEKMGVGQYVYYRHLGSFGKVITTTFSDFGNNTILIAKTLGGLFVGKNWDQIGGPVAILSASSVVLKNANFGTYIYLWGTISVNLAIFNLLPFPGLDGWHLLVVAIEAITKKEIPEKVKNIISAVGMILLFGLMIFIVGRDIFRI